MSFKRVAFVLLTFLSAVAWSAVETGVWTDSFSDGLAYAEENHVPFVLVWGNQDCDFCNALKTALNADPSVSAWMEAHPAVYVVKHDKVNSYTDFSGWTADNHAAFEWVKAGFGKKAKNFPMIGIYWPKATGAVVESYFTGRNGKMPVVSSKSGLAGQFIESLALSIGEYVGPAKVTFGERLPLIVPEPDRIMQAMPFPVDVNGDGLLDLLVGVKIACDEDADCSYEGKVRVYLNQGTPSKPVYKDFDYLTVNGEELLEEQDAGGCQGLQAQFGDFNGDGFPDLAVGHLAGQLEVYPGTSVKGVYGKPVQLLPETSHVPSNRTYACFHDVDGDGRDELFTGYMAGFFTMFAYDTETGTWSAGTVTDADGVALQVPEQTNNRRTTVAFADVDGDGNADLLAGATDGHVYLFPSVARGEWKSECSRIVTGEKVGERSRISVGDLNGDGVPDLVIGYRDGTVSWYKGSDGKTTEVVEDPVLTLAVDPGSTGTGRLSGGGTGPAGQVFSLVASPDAKTSGEKVASVFAGWYRDGVPLVSDDGTDWRQPKVRVTMPTDAETVITGRFVAKSDDTGDFKISCVSDAAGYVSGKAITPIAIDVDSLSYPVLSAKNLPSGISLDAAAFTLTGTPTQPGVYTVTLSAKNQSGKTMTADVTIRIRNFVDELIPIADEYGPFVPGVNQAFVIPEAVGCAASGLPAGMKFDKQTGAVSGAPTKPGIYTVTFTKTAQRVAYARKTSATFVVSALPRIAFVTSGSGAGTVKGAGAFVAGRKVSFSAAADKSSVFAGWYADGELLSKSSVYSDTMPAADVNLEARFVTKSEDAASIALNIAGEEMSAEETLSVTNDIGVIIDWPVSATALSAVTVKASGLPTGVKLVTDKATGAISLRGAPMSVSKLAKDGVTRVPSTIKVTVASAGKTTKTYLVALTVLPRGDWSAGTYDGAVTCELGRGTVTASVASNGKVSGKYRIGAKTYSFSAPALSDVTDDGVYLADVAVKVASGVTVTDTIALAPSVFEASMPEIGLFETDVAGGFTVLSNAVQNLWTCPARRAFAHPVFASGASYTVTFADGEDRGTLSFRFGTKGKVIVAGKVNGVTVSGSGQLLLDTIGPSACLCFARSFNGRVVVSFPKAGFCRTFAFSGDCETERIGPSDIYMEALSAGL